jgi:hypothetical protein
MENLTIESKAISLLSPIYSHFLGSQILQLWQISPIFAAPSLVVSKGENLRCQPGFMAWLVAEHQPPSTAQPLLEDVLRDWQASRESLDLGKRFAKHGR